MLSRIAKKPLHVYDLYIIWYSRQRVCQAEAWLFWLREKTYCTTTFQMRNKGCALLLIYVLKETLSCTVSAQLPDLITASFSLGGLVLPY